MKTSYLKYLALIGLFVSTTYAQAAEFNQVLADKSTISFGYKQMSVPLDGKFKKFSAQIDFDSTKPEQAQAKFDIDVASIDTGSSEGDDEVVGKVWFNAKAFPKASFISTSVKSLGANRFEVQGKLTIKGKTLLVSAPFTFKPDGANAIFDGAFNIKRNDYAIGEGEWADESTIANQIQIKFHITVAPAVAKK
ncbi:YceI family protein [Methyloradius palustris]|uniref:Polyisoprenoid-binding protein n=1 Tax=Methyloradius palustris TaxID=2778876 RepID=A0A8D5GEN5_9PROT|nr:YceI family protein [Methyloradius palustris]BCM26043.1 polyisoprenoid-binding protein [Methyloradius palustris]